MFYHIDIKGQKKLKFICIIPARLQSTRFPQKILKNLAGKPLLQWVWESAHKTNIFANISFAIDAQKTAKLISSFGGKYIMTSPTCQCGTQRLVELVKEKKIDGDIFVNWQADEPFITRETITHLLQSCKKDNADMWTLKKKMLSTQEILSPHNVKVVCDKNNHALYFSRHPIPFYRDKNTLDTNKIYYKHLGIYAYKKKTLLKIDTFNYCYLEDAEKLEQLRFLSNGISIKVHETNGSIIGIDTQNDLKNAEAIAKRLKQYG
jgi:3-deoxy-manno-octulosonate cytidylyltransferase (CMP-KDO synthetase)